MQYNIIFTVTIPNFYLYDLWHISHILVKNVKRDLLRFKLGLSNKSSKIIIDSLSLSHTSGPEWSEWKFMWSCYFLGNFFYFNNTILKHNVFKVMLSSHCCLRLHIFWNQISTVSFVYSVCLFCKENKKIGKEKFCFFFLSSISSKTK